MPNPIKFDEDQLEYIRELLAIRTPLHIIVERTRKVYELPELQGQHIQAIKKRDAELIKDIARRELNNTSAVGISFSRTRLELAQEMLFDACQPRPVSSYKETEIYIDTDGTEKTRDIYKIKYAPDHTAAAKWMDIVQKEKFWADKVTLEKLQKGMDTAPVAGIPVITAYTGYEDESEVILIEGSTEPVES